MILSCVEVKKIKAEDGNKYYLYKFALADKLNKDHTYKVAVLELAVTTELNCYEPGDLYEFTSLPFPAEVK